jgi:ribosomal protein S18 acetylase RimI-like enzyme
MNTMDVSRPNVVMRPARADDLPHLDEVRQAAFAPVFASFRSMLGEDIYELAQAREDEAQGELLISLLAPESGWKVYAAERGDTVVGFVAIRLNHDTHVGEIGLNAVHPDHAGKGVGTTMYDFAIARMKEAGMQVATVATGGDPSHAPARRAYEKAGFTVQIPSVWLCRKL